MKAGVQEGDRIVKVSTPSFGPAASPCSPHPDRPLSRPQVNGTMVTNSSHLEVVKLIKCEYGQGSCGFSSPRVTGSPQPAAPLHCAWAAVDETGGSGGKDGKICRGPSREFSQAGPWHPTLL